MAISVDVVGKLVNIDAVFKNSIGSVVDVPFGANYEWSVTAGGDIVTVEGTGADNAVGKVTPFAPGTATVSLTVWGGNLNMPLTGTLEITVASMEPVTVELNGTVVVAAAAA